MYGTLCMISAPKKESTTLQFTKTLQNELQDRGYSRRTFGRIAAAVGGGLTALPFFNEGALAQNSQVKGIPADAVLINANENPLGPCKEAMEAAHRMVSLGGRYRYDEGDLVQEILAEQEGVKLNYVKVYPGSSAPLHQAMLAFSSPTKALVVADPSYESAERAAQYFNNKVVKVPLTADYKHDVKKMAEVKDAGCFYICNPNNPTGTVTPQADIRWLVENKPKGSIVVIDEAYMHLSDEPFNNDLVAKDKDVIILRTFSKIYGMAGLRAGAAIARPDLIEKLQIFSAGMLPITGMAAASASLKVKNLVPERRKLIAEIRHDSLAWVQSKGFKCTPSVSNCFMIDVKKPGAEVMMAMRQDKVYIGRVWPSWPTNVRVTVGTKDEMAKFKTSFARVMGV